MLIDRRHRLFELMHKIGGMPLNEQMICESNGGNLPPGFATNDLIPLTVDAQQNPCDVNLNEEDELGLGAKLKPLSTQDIGSSWKNKIQAQLAKKTQGIGPDGRVHASMIKQAMPDFKNIIDPKTGDPIKPDDVKKKKINIPIENIPNVDWNIVRDILTTKPNDLLGQNLKMDKTNFYNISLPALKSLVYIESEKKFYVLTTCSKAGVCVNWCYAQLGRYVMFDSPIRNKMQKLNYLINHWEEWKSRIINEINELKTDGLETVIRWHDAGDFISEKYLQIALDIAKLTPSVVHYAYTKEISMVKGSENIPQNFEFKYSFSGKEDDQIGDLDPKGIVVPTEVFEKYLLSKPKNLTPEQSKDWEMAGMWRFSKESWDNIKNEISKKYNVPINSLLTHNEYVAMPHDRKKQYARQWHVIGKPGDSDLPASRKDTMTIFNLMHG